MVQFFLPLLNWFLHVVRSAKGSVPGGRDGGGYSGFQVTGIIEWGQKSKPKKSLQLPTKPEKILGPKINPQKIPCRISVLQSQNNAAGIGGHYHKSSDCSE